MDAPYTPEETERAFREGLAYFRPQEVAERAFSADLVPVRFEGAPQADSAQHYQGSAPYALYSLAGEPVVVEVTTGTIEWYRDRADARYTLRDPAGKALDTGRLPLDGEPHRLEFKVPAAGLYHFEFDDSAAGWRIAAAAGRPASILLDRGRGFLHAGHMQTMYCYVPKGTRTLQYFWDGGPHVLVRPDGSRHEVTTGGEIVSVDVPAGADGKPWAFTQLALGHLWFFNAPNVLAASPDALLLPAELVEADGLTRRQE